MASQSRCSLYNLFFVAYRTTDLRPKNAFTKKTKYGKREDETKFIQIYIQSKTLVQFPGPNSHAFFY